ncbi:MAG: DUF362 domain-containing protein [Candidatus Bathyarchaeia archaeon]
MPTCAIIVVLETVISVFVNKRRRCDLAMVSRVAVVEFEDAAKSLELALRLIGNIDDLNTSRRSAVIKVGVFDPQAENHTSVPVVDAIIKNFDKAPRIFLAESDNYKGEALERLQLWKELFSDRVVPFSLSDDTETKKLKLADEELSLSHVLFKPNVLVSTHVLRGYERGSILKNLFGLVPDAKKARFHKKLDTLLADIYEAIGGIDLAVLDGTYLYSGVGAMPHVGADSAKYRERMNTLVVGRDAVAVETVGAVLAGLKPEKMPVIQEFVKRGLGEGNMKNIEIVGSAFESLKEKFANAAKAQKRPRAKGGPPQTWGGQACRAMKSLMQDGFFKLPNKKSTEDVARAFEAKGIPTKNKEDKIASILTRRVKRAILKAAKGPNGWVYWTE